jgi:glutathione S-transferase
MSEPITRRVWGIGTSRTLRVHWMLAELDLDYETRAILTRTAGMQDPAFRALSGRGKIPLLEDSDLMIGESAAISVYLADRYRDRAILIPPAGSDARAVHDELCFFTMTEMDALLYVIRRHEGLAAIYGESKVACDAARGYFLRSAEEMERRLAGKATYLLGESFQVADLLLKTCLDWAAICGIPIPDALQPYSERIASRPAYSKAIAINFTPEAMTALAGSGPGATSPNS